MWNLALGFFHVASWFSFVLFVGGGGGNVSVHACICGHVGVEAKGLQQVSALFALHLGRIFHRRTSLPIWLV